MKTVYFSLCLLSLLFCRDSEENFGKPQGEEIVIAFPTDPVSLDPLFSTDLTTQKLIRLLYSPLFRLDSDGRPQGELAKTWIFFPEEQKLTVELASPELLMPARDALQRLIETPGPRRDHYSFLIKTTIESDPPRLVLHTQRLATREKREEALTLLSLPAASIPGPTGPYAIKEWKKGNYLYLERNPSTSPEFPRFLKIAIIPQSTSGLFLFSKGQVDAMKLTDFLLSHSIAKSNTILAKKGRSVQYVAINNTNPCFDKPFRQALNLAIQREKIIATILEGQAELTHNSIPRSRLLSWQNPRNRTQAKSVVNIQNDSRMSDLQMQNYDPQLAKKLLTESTCYPEILQRELDFRMRGDDENQSKGRAVAEDLRAIGLKVKIQGMEKAPLYRENGEARGDLTFLTWYADTESPFAFLDPLFHSRKVGNGGNRAFYRNPEMDSALETRNLDKALDILTEDTPWIFLWSIQENYLLSPAISRYPRLMVYM